MAVGLIRVADCQSGESTTEQATIATGATNLLLGALGGVMVPRSIMPEALQHLALLSPMSWGLEGFLDILLRGGGVSYHCAKGPDAGWFRCDRRSRWPASGCSAHQNFLETRHQNTMVDRETLKRELKELIITECQKEMTPDDIADDVFLFGDPAGPEPRLTGRVADCNGGAASLRQTHRRQYRNAQCAGVGELARGLHPCLSRCRQQ